MTDLADVARVPAEDTAATDALAQRLFQAAVATVEVASVHLGGRLGLYRALAAGGPASASELAARTGTAERYVREWLEQQAVAGLLSVDDPGAESASLRADPSAQSGRRQYALPAAHRAVLVD